MIERRGLLKSLPAALGSIFAAPALARVAQSSGPLIEINGVVVSHLCPAARLFAWCDKIPANGPGDTTVFYRPGEKHWEIRNLDHALETYCLDECCRELADIPRHYGAKVSIAYETAGFRYVGTGIIEPGRIRGEGWPTREEV